MYGLIVGIYPAGVRILREEHRNDVIGMDSNDDGNFNIKMRNGGTFTEFWGRKAHSYRDILEIHLMKSDRYHSWNFFYEHRT